MNNILIYSPLVIIAILAFYVVYRVMEASKNKRYVLPNFIEKDTEETEEYKSNKYIKWIFPSYVLSESQRYGLNMTKVIYTRYVTIGLLLGVIIAFVFFRSIIFSAIGGLILGLIIPNIILNRHKKKYRSFIQNELITYFKKFSSYLRAYDYSITTALSEVVSTTEGALLKDLEKVLFDLQQGSMPEVAFEPFNRKYDFKGVKLFHDQVVIVAELGHDTKNLLTMAAKKFAKKKSWQNKLETSNKKFTGESNLVNILTISIPAAFMIFTYEYYTDFITSWIGKVTMLIFLVWFFYIAYQIEKTAHSDPTEV